MVLEKIANMLLWSIDKEKPNKIKKDTSIPNLHQSLIL